MPFADNEVAPATESASRKVRCSSCISGKAKYSSTPIGDPYFVRSVGNFVINKTDYTLKDSLETNIDYFIEDIKKFFEHYRTTGKELQS